MAITVAKVNYERLGQFIPDRLLALERQLFEAVAREEVARKRGIEEAASKKRKAKKKKKRRPM